MALGLKNTDELSLLRTGQAAALAELFDHYRPRLARMIAIRFDSRLHGKVDAEDILQDAFVEAARRIDDFLRRPAVPLFVWLRQITSQILIDTRRHYVDAKMRNVNLETGLDWAQSGEDGSAFFAAQLADSLTTPSQFAVREEMLLELRSTLDSLEPIDREVLVLRHLEELTNDEVAAVLDINRYAASKRYLRALKRLRVAMPVRK